LYFTEIKAVHNFIKLISDRLLLLSKVRNKNVGDKFINKKRPPKGGLFYPRVVIFLDCLFYEAYFDSESFFAFLPELEQALDF
jgi:hypothetical protein